ncbi:DUF4886 domain-containing protein [Adhaeretor mobilis]|uniref:PEP-CTERM sorting domain-containing protein n=1 Tax=Adhaeretor mobilis TaxID=1930276 RepID=A0A517N1U1_9BACT|nr:DUF4886 domain-containing protein [Adhaeretor mobilis]QDT01101.1 hypothetical protein HG15A2_44430 [Adhaeretor mobilis]
MKLSIVLGLLVAAMAVAPARSQTTSYSIGNSFTQDGFKFSNGQELLSGFEQIVLAEGGSHETVPHIRCSSALHSIVADPDTVCITPRSPYDKFPNALPNYEWDFVTMQPHLTQSSTLQDDIDSILTFISLAQQNPQNADTVFYIYATWPGQTTWPYQSEWETPFVDDPTTATRSQREYYEHLLEDVRELTDATVYVVPAGEVLFELDKQIAAGTIPGVTSLNYFYRDLIHLTDEGRYMAAMTFYSMFFKTSPVGLARPTISYGDESATTPGLNDILQQTIWDVVSDHPLSGYTDFNNDEFVDDLDLNIWSSDYGSDRGGEDFIAWQRTYRPPLSNVAGVPEPTTLVLSAMATLSVLLRPRRCAWAGV